MCAAVQNTSFVVFRVGGVGGPIFCRREEGEKVLRRPDLGGRREEGEEGETKGRKKA